MTVRGTSSSLLVSEDGTTFHSVDGISKMRFEPKVDRRSIAVMGEESGDYGAVDNMQTVHQEWGFSCGGAYEDESNGQGTIRRAFSSGALIYVRTEFDKAASGVNPQSGCYVEKYKVGSAADGLTSFSASFVGAGDDSADKVDGSGLVITDAVAGADSSILSTGDTGSTWADEGVLYTTDESVKAVHTLDSGVVLAGTTGSIFSQGGRVYNSDDAGGTWTFEQLLSAYTTRVHGFDSNGTTVCAACHDDNGGSQAHVYRSTDSGGTWADSSSGYLGEEDCTCIAHVSGDIWVCGTSVDGSMWKSTDDGDTWTKKQDIFSLGPVAVLTLSNGNVLVGDPWGGSIWLSTNSGDSYSQVLAAPVAQSAVESMAEGASGVVVAVTSQGSGYYYRSTNYGASWTQMAKLHATYIEALTCCYMGSQVFLVGGENGRAYKSTDNGATFSDLGQQQSKSWIYEITAVSS